MPWQWRFWHRYDHSTEHEARRHRQDLASQQPEVDRLTEAMERRRQANNFRRAVEDAMRGAL